MTSNEPDVLPEFRALLKLCAAGDLHVANQLLDSLDDHTTRQLIFSLVGGIQQAVTGATKVFESAAELLRSAGVPNSLDADAARRQFEASLGTDFGSHHGS